VQSITSGVFTTTFGVVLTVIFTSEEHELSAAVHVNVLIPDGKPVIVLFGSVGSVMVATLDDDHDPVRGEIAVKLVLVLPQAND
jgi:hypothetical protein